MAYQNGWILIRVDLGAGPNQFDPIIWDDRSISSYSVMADFSTALGNTYTVELFRAAPNPSLSRISGCANMVGGRIILGKESQESQFLHHFWLLVTDFF